jgi:hypothetical protein
VIVVIAATGTKQADEVGAVGGEFGDFIVVR